MKAQTKVCSATSRMAAHFGFTASEHYRISKHRPENGEAEMQACFHKLKELVPTVPQNKNVSKVQLLQHVIDYILDLELTLDFSPLESADTPPPEMLPASAHQLPGRRPLAESSSVNTPIPQETSHLAPEMDFLAQQCDSRPASC